MILTPVIAAVGNVLKDVPAPSVANPWPQINTILVTIAIGLLGMILKDRFNNRKLTVQVNGEVRAEFIQEMENLRIEVRGLRDENAKLRDEVRGLNDIITGMSRQQAGAHSSAQRVLASTLPHTPEMSRALDSLGNVEGDRRG